MYSAIRYLHFFSLITIQSIKCDFVPINWNISTDRAKIHDENQYKYPMFTNVAPFSCDLSTDTCDTFCCNGSEKSNFNRSEPIKTCIDDLSKFDCNCDYFNKPEWLTFFCFVYKNPIFLGKFYKTLKNIDSVFEFKKIIHKNNHFYNYKLKYQNEVSSFTYLKYKSPIMTYIPMSETFSQPSIKPLTMKTKLKESSTACISTSVKFRVNESSTCVVKITQELCEKGVGLSINPYILRNYSDFSNSFIPSILKNLNYLESIKSKVTLYFVKPKLIEKKFKKEKYYIFDHGEKKEHKDFDFNNTVWNNSVCQNVLSYVNYEFVVNGSELIELKADYGVMDIPIPFGVPKAYFKQIFSVSFFDIFEKSEENFNLTEKTNLTNRGYFIDEPINFGYKILENSTSKWKKGVLGIFNNGGFCEIIKKVKFGYSRFSSCLLREKFLSCKHRREFLEKALDSLLQGDHVAPYSFYEAPYENPVPLLRNYLNSSEIENKSRSECLVAVGQDIAIQYTSVFKGNKDLVYRVIGIKVDRTLANVVNDSNLRLNTRISFLFSSSSKRISSSRYWEKVRSGENSENSWLNIFNGFDKFSPTEETEVIFWLIILLFCICAGITCTKLNLRNGKEDREPNSCFPKLVC